MASHKLCAPEETTGTSKELELQDHGIEKKRSFFVIGAPRCGTSSLCKALKKNPRISFSKPKETHYFLNSHEGMSLIEKRKQYLEGFHQKINDTHQAIGDGSVSHLYSIEAIKRIIEFDQNARFIVLCRNPVDMITSYHRRLLYTLDEDIEDFPLAWKLQTARGDGTNIPKKCRDPRLLQYKEVGSIGHRIQDILQIVPIERCHIIVFDDFIKCPLKTYKEVLEFVGVDYDGQDTFPRYASGSGYHSKVLQYLIYNPPNWLLRFVNLDDHKAMNDLRRRFSKSRRWLKSVNTQKTPKKSMPDDFRNHLKEAFQDDISVTEQILNRDLSHWRT